MKSDNKMALPSIWIWIGCIIVVLAISTQISVLYLRRKQNTERAKQVLIEIYERQKIFKASLGKGSYNSDPSFFYPAPKEISPFFDISPSDLSKPVDGYFIKMVQIIPKTKDGESTFSVAMYPEKATGFFQTGNDCFYLDQTGIIRHSGSPTQIPDANSPPIE